MDDSAGAWIADMGEHGDFTRRFVLDPVMVGRVAGRGFATALDVGCGEGRFCGMLRGHGVRPVEPEAMASADPAAAGRYRRAPYCYVMEWRKPD